MPQTVDIDVWVREMQRAAVRQIVMPAPVSSWTDDDVRTLLTEMLRAIEREKNPAGEPPPVSLRGFNWIVTPYESDGVVLHLEMTLGTASAGPLAIEEPQLSAMVARVMDPGPRGSIH
jgi:hypothetical protein